MSAGTRIIQAVFVVGLAMLSPYLTIPVSAISCEYEYNHTGCSVMDMKEIEDAVKQQCGPDAAPGCSDFCFCARDVVDSFCTGVTNWWCEDTDCPVQWCTWHEDCCEGGCWEGECEGPIPPAPFV
jgi:hypothetical protein